MIGILNNKSWILIRSRLCGPQLVRILAWDAGRQPLLTLPWPGLTTGRGPRTKDQVARTMDQLLELNCWMSCRPTGPTNLTAGQLWPKNRSPNPESCETRKAFCYLTPLLSKRSWNPWKSWKEHTHNRPASRQPQQLGAVVSAGTMERPGLGQIGSPELVSLTFGGLGLLEEATRENALRFLANIRPQVRPRRNVVLFINTSSFNIIYKKNKQEAIFLFKNISVIKTVIKNS